MRKLHYSAEHHQRTSNYFWLLVFLSTLLLFPVFSVFFQSYSALVFNICVSFVIVWGAYVVTQTQKGLIISCLLGLLALIGFWIDDSNFQPSRGIALFRTLTGIAYFSFLGQRISLQLIRSHGKVNLNLLYGAIICFLIIGFVGGQLCILLDIAQPGSFFEPKEVIDSYKYYYFSFVTLSTLGYGDITPNNEAGQALSLFIALFGQIYLTIIMAIIIGKYLNVPNNIQP